MGERGGTSDSPVYLTLEGYCVVIACESEAVASSSASSTSHASNCSKDCNAVKKTQFYSITTLRFSLALHRKIFQFTIVVNNRNGTIGLRELPTLILLEKSVQGLGGLLVLLYGALVPINYSIRCRRGYKALIIHTTQMLSIIFCRYDSKFIVHR